MQRFLPLFGAVAISLVCFQQGCGEETTPAEPAGSGPQAAANATNGTGYDPVCNNGRPDGFCNALGQNPEGCDCRDCFGTAFCDQRCVDDGNCSFNGDDPSSEDCTCADCAYVHPECGAYQPPDDDDGDGDGDGDGDASTAESSSGSGDGGAGSSTAETSAETTAETTAETVAGSGGGGGA
jgi:hypothetical protein